MSPPAFELRPWCEFCGRSAVSEGREPDGTVHSCCAYCKRVIERDPTPVEIAERKAEIRAAALDDRRAQTCGVDRRGANKLRWCSDADDFQPRVFKHPLRGVK